MIVHMATPSRRNILTLAAAAAPGAAHAQPLFGQSLPGGPEADWAWLHGRFLSAKGQLMPSARPAATEAFFQAVGLLSALHAQDIPRFERILAWSLNALRRPDDSLWIWRRDEARDTGLPDLNNATHADLLAAWALVQAGEHWRRPDLRRLGAAMAGDILARCLLPGDGPPLLLPGAGGFFNARRGVLSPGGMVLPALAALSQAVPDRRWEAVRAEALALIRRARFGAWQLPADWVELDRTTGRLTLATGWPARFSFLAAGAVLHLCWTGLGQDPVVSAAMTFWEDRAGVPAWIDLRDGRIGPTSGHAGLRAVARLAAAASLGRGTMDMLPRMPAAADDEAATLLLLCRMAWREIGLSRRGE